ncbi:hypothetical protein SCAR479_10241 [Seiridium cardinale]|uniref:Uncharacterized protein n=1 Tax=Seiridium cardinale TaxID=138064 RepID=A0ABR2XH32_9PEZI
MSFYQSYRGSPNSSQWHLDGFHFNDRTSVAANRVYMAVLTQCTFLPPLPHGTAGPLRYQTNLRVIFEAVQHFSKFWGARNFWIRLRDVLGFDVRTRAIHLESIVAGYCEGRKAYKHRTRDAPAGTRLNRLVDMTNEMDEDYEQEGRPSVYSISHSQWQELCPAWLKKLYEIKKDLRISEEQIQHGTCHPALLKNGPPLSARITAPSHEAKSLPESSTAAKSQARTRSPSPVMTISGHVDTHTSDEKAHKVGAPMSAKQQDLPQESDPLVQNKTIARPRGTDDRRQSITFKLPQNQSPHTELLRSPRGTAGKRQSPDSPEENRPWKRCRSETSQEVSLATEDNVSRIRCGTRTEPHPGEVVSTNCQFQGSGEDVGEQTARTDGQTSSMGEISNKNIDCVVEVSRLDLRLPEMPGPITSMKEARQEESPGPSERSKCKTEHAQECSSLPGHDTDEFYPPEDAEYISSKVSATGSIDDINRLLVRLKSRQKRLEDMEASMQAWQDKFAQQAAQQAQEQSQRLDTQIQDLRDQLAQSEQKRLNGMEILNRTLDRAEKQRTLNRQRVDKLEGSIARVLQQQDESAVAGRFQELEVRLEESKQSCISERDHRIDMAADILNLTAQIDARVTQEQIGGLKCAIRALEDQLNTKRGQNKTIDDVKDLQKCYSELRSELTQRTDDFETALNSMATKQSEQKSNKVFQEELEDLRVWSTKRSTKIKERVDGLMSLVEGMRGQVDQYSEQSTADRKRVESLSSDVSRLQSLEPQLCTENNRINTIEEVVQTLKSQPKPKVSVKRVESLEKTVKELQALSYQEDQDMIKNRLNDLATALGSLEDKLGEFASEEQVDRLEAITLDLKTRLPEASSAIPEQVEIEIRDLREYVDHTLGMVNATSQKRLGHFQEQIKGIEKQVMLAQSQHTEQLPTPVSPVNHGISLPDDARIAILQRQADDLREQLRQKNEVTITQRLLSPSVSDLESLVGQAADPKDILSGVVVELKKLRGLMRKQILDMDAAGEEDDDKKFCISDVGYELGRVLQFAKNRVQELS